MKKTSRMLICSSDAPRARLCLSCGRKIKAFVDGDTKVPKSKARFSGYILSSNTRPRLGKRWIAIDLRHCLRIVAGLPQPQLILGR